MVSFIGSDLPLIITLSLLGCPGPTPPISTDPPTVVPTGEPICGPLQIEPDAVVLQADQEQAFRGRGGSGSYVFTVIGEGGGGINSAGVYTAPSSGSSDQVVLTDAGCPGSSTAELTLVPALEIAPRSAFVLPETVIPMQIEGGSGSTTCELLSNNSGALLTQDCIYTAGADAGVDTLRVTDVQTGVALDAIYEVSDSGGLTAMADVWVLPLGAFYEPQITGGSGQYEFRSDRALVEVDAAAPGRLQGASIGNATVTVTDALIPDLSASFELRVIGSLVPPATLDGMLSGRGQLLSGDLNGDGFEDAVFGAADASVDGPAGGVVAVFPGLADGGISTTPGWQVTGTSLEEHVGAGVALADLDADGITDLLVGAPGASDGLGEVRVYSGLAAGFFTPQPTSVVSGSVAGDQLGTRVGACDLDGDGGLDLVATGLIDDALGGSPPELGSISVYRGTTTGLSNLPVVRFGAAIGDGAFTGVANQRVGAEGFALGDVNGDGRCDVAVGSARNREGGAGAGAVFVYAGRSDGSMLSSAPVQVFGGAPSSLDADQFGHSLDLADVNGDGRADLLVGARYRDEGATNSGAAYLFAGDDFPADPLSATELEEAGWTLASEGAFDALGSAVEISPGSDGTPQLWVGAPRFGDGGAVWRFAGESALIGTPVVATVADGVPFVGQEADVAFGTQLSGREDGSVLVMEGQHSDADAVDVERFVVHDGSNITPIMIFGQPSLQRFGASLASLDIDGVAGEELLLGGPDAADPALGALSGRIEALHSDGTWSPLVGGPPSLSSTDHQGIVMATGDFDGDGRTDLINGIRSDGRPELLDGFLSTCGVGPVARGGAVTITLGSSSGLSDGPSFVIYGATPNARVTAVASGFDHNGDGYDDVLVAFGGFAAEVVLAYGRPAPGDGETVELCGEHVFRGEVAEAFGSSLGVLGDVEGAGCDAFAIGSRLADPLLSNEGSVHVVWGAGPGCASSAIQTTLLRSGIPSAQGGWALAGGLDVTGDGLDDLAIGGPGRASFGLQTGAVWVVGGDWLATLPREPWQSGGLSDTIAGVLASQTQLNGPVFNGGFGESLALVSTSTGSKGLAVGARRAEASGVPGGGGVAVYRWDAGVLSDRPWLWMTGETSRPGASVGGALLLRGTDIIVGAAGSSAEGTLQNGGAYRVPL